MVMSKMSDARKGFLTIVGATGLAQVVGLGAIPIIGRLYPPAEFGPFAVVNAAALPLAALASLRYEMAVPLPKRERESRAVASLGLRSAAIFAAACTALAVIASLAIPGWWVGGWLLTWVPVIAGLMAAFAVLNQVAVRHRAYSAIARRNVLMAISVVSFQILAGIAGAGPHGLAAGLAAGQLVGVVSLWWSLKPHFAGPGVPRSERREAWQAYRRFPLVLAPAGVVNVLGLSAPLLLAAALYGDQVSGLLGMTQRVLTIPVTLVGLALAQVYIGEFARAKREGSADLRRMFVRTSKRLGSVAVVAALVVFLASPYAFPLVLGEEWARSGQYATALAVAMGAQLCVSPLSQTVIVMGRPGMQAAWDLSRLILCSGSIVLASWWGWDDMAAVTLFGAMMALTYAVGWWLSWWTVTHPLPENPLESGGPSH